MDKQPDEYDFAHVIHEITFGSKIRKISQKGVGTFNSLGGREKMDANGLESHEYVMKIVPTTYEDLVRRNRTWTQNQKLFLENRFSSQSANKLVAYQYTYAYRSYVSFGHGGRVVPAVW